MDLFQMDFDQLQDRPQLVIGIDDDLFMNEDLELDDESFSENDDVQFVLKQEKKWVASGELQSHDLYNALKRGMITEITSSDMDNQSMKPIKVIPMRMHKGKSMDTMLCLGFDNEKILNIFVTELNPLLCFALLVSNDCEYKDEIINAIKIKKIKNKNDLWMEETLPEAVYYVFHYVDADVYILNGHDAQYELELKTDHESEYHITSVKNKQKEEIARFSIQPRKMYNAMIGSEKQTILEKSTGIKTEYKTVDMMEKNSITSVVYTVESIQEEMPIDSHIEIATPINDEFELITLLKYTKEECKKYDTAELIEWIIDLANIVL